MHGYIATLYGMPGETLYWRYTIALKLVHTVVRWKLTEISCKRDDTNRLSKEAGVISLTFRPLDTQFKGILKEGLMKKGGLPWDRTLCILETHNATYLYAASWKFLRGLFHLSTEDIAP
jgi:hypothetical protein